MIYKEIVLYKYKCLCEFGIQNVICETNLLGKCQHNVTDC